MFYCYFWIVNRKPKDLDDIVCVSTSTGQNSVKCHLEYQLLATVATLLGCCKWKGWSRCSLNTVTVRFEGMALSVFSTFHSLSKITTVLLEVFEVCQLTPEFKLYFLYLSPYGFIPPSPPPFMSYLALRTSLPSVVFFFSACLLPSFTLSLTCCFVEAFSYCV